MLAGLQVPDKNPDPVALNGNDFAAAIDRAITRSGKLIEAKAIEPGGG